MENILTCDMGIQTGASGGVISGTAFGCGKKLYYEDCKEDLKKALKSFDGPLRKKAKAERVLKCSELFIASLKQMLKEQGADEVVSLLWTGSSLARWAHDTLLFKRAYSLLEEEQRTKDVIYTLFVLASADEHRYDSLYVLK